MLSTIHFHLNLEYGHLCLGRIVFATGEVDVIRLAVRPPFFLPDELYADMQKSKSNVKNIYFVRINSTLPNIFPSLAEADIISCDFYSELKTDFSFIYSLWEL